jgi:hypothetical protein
MSSRRYIICPEIYKYRWTDFYRSLFQCLSVELNAQIIYTSKDPEIPIPDLLFLFAVPQHDRQGFLFDWIMSLPKETKIISYMRDLHTFDNPIFELEIAELFDRFDIIISPAQEFFIEHYPEYVQKMFFMPDFFGPETRYTNLKIQEDPIRKCLLSGASVPKIYPIRNHILQHGDGHRIVYIPPPYPTCPHDFIGDKYARCLNKFECCVTDSGACRYAVTKVFEITAAGSLLLCDQIKDLDACGFVPWEHYIPITLENSLETIYTVLDNPEKYQRIKEQGRSFTHNNHGIRNRVVSIKTLIGRC